jgi:hypothetical protein
MNYFKLYFEADIKKLGLTKYKVCKILDCSRPTLSSRIDNPGRFTIDEIQTLKENGFESMNRLI